MKQLTAIYASALVFIFAQSIYQGSGNALAEAFAFVGLIALGASLAWAIFSTVWVIDRACKDVAATRKSASYVEHYLRTEDDDERRSAIVRGEHYFRTIGDRAQSAALLASIRDR